MATYEFSYRLETAPSQTTDGSGQIRHSVVMAYREQGSGDNWRDALRVPGHIAQLLIPASEIAVVMNMPHSAGAERQAKNAAYKQLLIAHRDSKTLAMGTGWQEAAAQQFLDNNDASAAEAASANEYITVTLGQAYPVPFE